MTKWPELSTEVQIGLIRAERDLQARENMNAEAIHDYVDAIVEGVELPAIVVYLDGDGVYWLADGWHRLEAHRRIARETIRCEIRPGDRRAAVLAAVCANLGHGLRRTNADKRRAVTLLLADPEWAQWSDREIGRKVGVDGKLAAAVRHGLAERAGVEVSTERRGADGRVIDTARIGRVAAPAIPPDTTAADPEEDGDGDADGEEPLTAAVAATGALPVRVSWFHEPADLDFDATRAAWSGTNLAQRHATARVVEWRGGWWVNVQSFVQACYAEIRLLRAWPADAWPHPKLPASGSVAADRAVDPPNRYHATSFTADMLYWLVDASEERRVARGWAPPDRAGRVDPVRVPVLSEAQWRRWLELRVEVGDEEALRVATGELTPVTGPEAEALLEDVEDELPPEPEPEPAAVERIDRILEERAERLAEARRLLDELEPSRDELRAVLGGREASDVRASVRNERRAGDAYYTPDHVALGLTRWLRDVGYLPGRRPTARILEGHVGGGAWLRALRVLGIAGHVSALDVDEKAVRQHLDPEGQPIGDVGDFLTYEWGNKFDLILGNPPFTDAEDHVRRALELLAPRGILAWILRRDWMGAARGQLVASGLAPVEEVVLEPRVSFTADGGSDMREHSLFVWRQGTQRIHWRTRMLAIPAPAKRGGSRAA